MIYRNLLNYSRLILLITVFSSVISNLSAQKGSFETLWERTSLDGTRPDWFSDGVDDGSGDPANYFGTERGIAYSATTGHLYVCSRKLKQPSIHIINPLTGEDIGDLITLGIEAGGDFDGGGYCLNNITTTEGGQIVACNMTLASGPTVDGVIKAFRVYKWSYESVAPEKILDYQEGGYRLGDKFSVFGDLSGEATIFALPADGNKVLKWTVSGGIVNQTPEIITLAGVTSVSTSPSAELVPGTSNMYVMGRGFIPTYFTADGTNLTQLALSTPFTAHGGKIAKINNELYMAMYQGTGGDYQRAVLINITDHGENVTDDDIYGYTTSLGNTITAWGEGAVELKIIDDTMRVFVCAPDIGIAGYKAVDLIAGTENIATDKFNMNIYPNPCSYETTVEFFVPQEFNKGITLSIYDLTGKIIKTYTNLSNRNNKIVFNTENLSNGLYFCKLKAGNIEKTQKITVIKK